MTQRNQHDEMDRAFDAALSNLAPTLTLPDAPDASRVAAWKGAEEGGAGVVVRRVGRRRSYFIGTGLAAAAGLAIGAFFLFPGGQSSRVHAAIVQSLRSASVRALNITFDHVESEGVDINGRVALRFPEAFAIADLVDEGTGRVPDISLAHASLSIRMGDGSELSGANLSIEAASAPGSSWVYLLAQGELQPGANPAAGMVLNVARQGLLVDLGDRPFFGSIEHADVPAEMGAAIDQHFSQRSRGSVHVGLSATSHVGGDSSSPPAGGGEPPRSGLHVGIKLNEVAGNEQGRSLVRRFLAGQAGAEDLSQLYQAFTGEPGDQVSLENLGDGRFVMTMPAEADGSTLRISYLEQSGVEWAEIDTRSGGHVRIDFAESAIAASLLDKERMIEPGRTRVIRADSSGAISLP